MSSGWHEAAFSASMRRDSDGASYARVQESIARCREHSDEEHSVRDLDGGCVGGCVGRLVEVHATRRLGTKEEVVIETSAMFAKTVLGVQDTSALCQYLQDLDKEETEKQEVEEKEIQQKRLEVKAGLNATTTIAAASALGIILHVMPFPVAHIGAAAAGAIAALISDNTDAFGHATPLAIKNLDLHKKRTVRLEEKVRKIATARVSQGQEQVALGQLERTEAAFSTTIRKYRDWEETLSGSHT